MTTPDLNSEGGNMVSQRQVEWVLVPREPTEAMVGNAAWTLYAPGPKDFALARQFYRAMLAAAPPAEPRADEGAVSQSQSEQERQP